MFIDPYVLAGLFFGVITLIGFEIGLRNGERHGRAMALLELAIQVMAEARAGVTPRSDETPEAFAERLLDRLQRCAWRNLKQICKRGGLP